MTSRGYSSHQSVLYGVHPVLETLKAGRRRIDEILLARDPASYGELVGLLQNVACPVTRVSDKDVLAIAGSAQHQGVAARVGPFPYTDFADVAPASVRLPCVLILLDEIQDPVNLGSILRSAECLGASAVILTRDNAAQVTPAVERASAGASAHIAVSRVVNLVRAIEQLKDAGFWVYAADSGSQDTVYSLDLSGSVAFVLGSEGRGVRRLVREKCDRRVSIPIFGKVGSLNVSHAAAILLAEFSRQRNDCLRNVPDRSND
ncbi:MAG: 23S rRNA (guanosine(2251)-2'-O)-methyltransferase RlmB [Deltaproteobacteria bacterium]|nr:23S rRNA (guanosine(2251)-2'-O)-methyltransferase RlmB [Deltaproteobacteria bacterium]